jgi:hypothetical protein
MTAPEGSYNLPIWRRAHRAVSPDGRHWAEIDPAYEVSMGNPTSGVLRLSTGLELPRCNPSFLWSDDSRYLAVPRFFDRFGLFRRQRLVVIAVDERTRYQSRLLAYYFQPESFSAGELVVTANPFRGPRQVRFRIPTDLEREFTRLDDQ